MIARYWHTWIGPESKLGPFGGAMLFIIHFVVGITIFMPIVLWILGPLLRVGSDIIIWWWGWWLT